MLQLRMPPIPEYAIFEPETIGLRVPSETVVSRAVLDAVHTFEVQRTLVSRGVVLSGPLVERGSEALVAVDLRDPRRIGLVHPCHGRRR